MNTARWAGFFLAGLFLGTFSGCQTPAGSSRYAIRWSGSATGAAVDVTGIDAATLEALAHVPRSPVEWPALLAVYAEQPSDATETVRALPPMLGSWSVRGNLLRFQPAYPFVRTVRYRAEFHPTALPGGPVDAAPVISFFQLPQESTSPTTTVTQIYPSANVLPENQLKFYIQFSAPMSRGDIYQYIHLRDSAGHEGELPFLDIDEELWDPSMTHLTLLIDPGRIKRGVKPLEDLGPVFENGKSYSLTLDAAWHDANGRPLREAFRKEFRIGLADRTPPDPARWTIQPAPAGTVQPITVAFDEPMDRALALRLITVTGPQGESLSGEASLSDQERHWSFVPAQPWRIGSYKLVVATKIEDLAGNNIGKVFDVDVFENVQRQLDSPTVTVSFEVK